MNCKGSDGKLSGVNGNGVGSLALLVFDGVLFDLLGGNRL